MLAEARPTERLSRILDNYRLARNLSVRQLHRRLRHVSPYSYSTLRRLVNEETASLSLDAAIPIAGALAAEIGMEPEQLFLCLLHNRGAASDGRFAEVAMATVWRRDRQSLGGLADVMARQRGAGRVILFSPFIPCSLAPDRLTAQLTRCLAGDRLGSRALGVEVAFARKLRRLLSGYADRTKLVPVFRSGLEVLARLEPPFENLTKGAVAEFLESVGRDAAEGERILPALVEDRDPTFPRRLRQHFGRHLMAIAVGESLVVKQSRVLPAARLSYEWGEDPSRNDYVAAEVRLLEELLGWVRHELTPDAAVRELEQYLP